MLNARPLTEEEIEALQLEAARVLKMTNLEKVQRCHNLLVVAAQLTREVQTLRKARGLPPLPLPTLPRL